MDPESEVIHEPSVFKRQKTLSVDESIVSKGFKEIFDEELKDDDDDNLQDEFL